MNIEKMKEGYKVRLLGKDIVSVDKSGEFTYNLESLQKIKEELANKNRPDRPITNYNDLGLPDIEYLRELEQKKQSKELEKSIDKNEGEREEVEKDDKKPKLDKKNEDKSKEEIAKKYNVDSRQVVHIAMDEKVTQDERFQNLAQWAEGYDDIYVMPGKDNYTWHTIGVKEGKEEEIEQSNNRQIGGKNPDITIKRIDGEKIEEVKPLAMYELDNNESYALVRDKTGEVEMLYCRQEGGDEKTYWGIIVPEASGDNTIQRSPEERSFISPRNNSSEDLSKKAEELEKAADLDERGIPSEEKGVQTYEIEGTSEQNRKERKEQIVEDLLKRDGILDRANAMPGYYENKAERVLRLMENNKKITYEEAVERVEQTNREPGGNTPDNKRTRV